MTTLLRHRGPDAEGFWRGDGVGLGHRRLAILDLSPAGAQPMCDEAGAIHLVCNGEIYDYQTHNAVLTGLGHHIRSGSDSETLVHLYEEHGEGLLERVNGMFAMALWDQFEKRLLVAVDRFGKKPLYYACLGERLVLASELKSLLLFPWVSREPDPAAVDRYLALRYVPAPMTILKSIRKLEPSSLLEWREGRVRVRTYWKPAPQACGAYGPAQVDDFQELLTDAIRLRLQSDVPLGLYLSGGVDSSAVAGIMSGMTPGEKVSYSVGFD
ncbi:MAG TPA: asparagine synthetase B, partial [Holophaga sp.]|nr:asparagine synthetase B [Holophaga sp.]